MKAHEVAPAALATWSNAPPRMTPPRDWFALQLCFAERAAVLTGLPFEEAVLRFTNIYRRCGLGRARNPDHPIWQDYVCGLRVTSDRAAWTAEYCRTRAQPVCATFFGCFQYAYCEETRQVRLHFANNDDSGAGPLSKERQLLRHAELRALFVALARAHPAARTVRGVSWLHGIAAYRRLYPAEYGESARPMPAESVFPSMPLWGQFLDHTSRVKDDLAVAFLAGVARARTVSGLAACFPHPVYAVKCEITHFYRFFGVPHPVVSVPESAIRQANASRYPDCSNGNGVKTYVCVHEHGCREGRVLTLAPLDVD